LPIGSSDLLDYLVGRWATADWSFASPFERAGHGAEPGRAFLFDAAGAPLPDDEAKVESDERDDDLSWRVLKRRGGFAARARDCQSSMPVQFAHWP